MFSSESFAFFIFSYTRIPLYSPLPPACCFIWVLILHSCVFRTVTYGGAASPPPSCNLLLPSLPWQPVDAIVVFTCGVHILVCLCGGHCSDVTSAVMSDVLLSAFPLQAWWRQASHSPPLLYSSALLCDVSVVTQRCRTTAPIRPAGRVFAPAHPCTPIELFRHPLLPKMTVLAVGGGDHLYILYTRHVHFLYQPYFRSCLAFLFPGQTKMFNTCARTFVSYRVCSNIVLLHQGFFWPFWLYLVHPSLHCRYAVPCIVFLCQCLLAHLAYPHTLCSTF